MTRQSLGVTHNGLVAYSYEKLVKCLVEHDEMSEEDAIEYIDYNIIGSLNSEDNFPIVIYDM